MPIQSDPRRAELVRGWVNRFMGHTVRDTVNDALLLVLYRELVRRQSELLDEYEYHNDQLMQAGMAISAAHLHLLDELRK